MTDINEMVGEQIENLSKGVEAERREIEDYKASGNAELIIAARVMQQHFDRKTKNLNAWLAIQDVLELHKADTDEWNLDKCMGCGLNSYEERIELSDCETRQAITNRLGGMK